LAIGNRSNKLAYLILAQPWHTIAGMLLLLQVAPQLPPIYVTVQQPTGGMPEWAKILISAGVGTLLGMASTVVMEFVKPRIAKRQLKRSIATQLLPEAKNILGDIGRAKELIERIDHSASRDMVRAVMADKMKSLTWQRYELYISEEQRTLYEMDPDDEYGTLRRWIQDAIECAESADYDITKASLDECTQICSNLIRGLEAISSGKQWSIMSADGEVPTT
jgi:hypothetical protein